MKAFNLFVKIAAIGLMLYVFMQQKNDYYAEMRGKPKDPAPITNPAPAPKVQ